MSTTFTPNFNLAKFSVGDTGWGALADANMDIIDANLVNSLPRGYRAGCGTTLSGGTPSTVISIAVGTVQDIGNAGSLNLAASITKNINAAWAVGSGNGGLALALVLTASTWYHLYLIKRTDTNVVDAYFDTSTSAANIPAPYTLFRRVASCRTDANRLIEEYTQIGRTMLWRRLKNDTANFAAISATAGTYTVTVPTGVEVEALIQAFCSRAANNTGIRIYSPGMQVDAVIDPTANAIGNVGGTAAGATILRHIGDLRIMTNTSAQVMAVNVSGDAVDIRTKGWMDFQDEF